MTILMTFPAGAGERRSAALPFPAGDIGAP
jgi:hypothetical protein